MSRFKQGASGSHKFKVGDSDAEIRVESFDFGNDIGVLLKIGHRMWAFPFDGETLKEIEWPEPRDEE